MIELTVEAAPKLCTESGKVGLRLDSMYGSYADVLLDLESIYELYRAIGKLAASDTPLHFLTICDSQNWEDGGEDFLELKGCGEFATLIITTQSSGEFVDLELQVSLPALIEWVSVVVEELAGRSADRLFL
jgi:hypothetical protein